MIREVGTFFDPFDPYLVRNALADTDYGLRSVVFGWDIMHMDGPSNDVISELFKTHGEFSPDCMNLQGDFKSYY